MVDDEGAVDEMDEVTEVLGFMVDAISPACVPTTQRDRQAIFTARSDVAASSRRNGSDLTQKASEHTHAAS